MPDAQPVVAEINRLSRMSPDAFMGTVVQYVTGGTDKRAPRDVQGQALGSPQLAPRVLEALEMALKHARTFLPRQEGETKRDQQARIVPWRERIRAAMDPVWEVLDDLAHEHTKVLAALDDAAFTRRWTAFVLGRPTPDGVSRSVEGLAFRSPRVAARAGEVCRLMFEEPARFMPPAAPGESGNARAQRVDDFRRRVGAEARYLRYATQYAEARQGRMPSEPNVRLQALKLLGERHPQELMQLLRQVRGEETERRTEARRDRRDLRRAAGQGTR
ncbi:hypothetical protein ACIQVL_03670 [Streptomyces sp. NPDC090499]|uniref:hypothetical protein n=1 Tax=Streptomyces sp. NPDC090499 TaxID=3365965 RepID=UPI00380D08BB